MAKRRRRIAKILLLFTLLNSPAAIAAPDLCVHPTGEISDIADHAADSAAGRSHNESHAEHSAHQHNTPPGAPLDTCACDQACADDCAQYSSPILITDETSHTNTQRDTFSKRAMAPIADLFIAPAFRPPISL